MILALFDLDGTLYSGHIGRGIILHHRTQKVGRFNLYLYLITHYPFWFMTQLHLISEARARQLWAGHMAWTVRGWTRERAAEAFAWIAREYVRPRLLPAVLDRLDSHQRAGHRVIVVSGTPAPLLGEIGRQLGVEETVGTPLVMRNGRYTGASESPICQGAGKAARLDAYLGPELSILWEESVAYADSWTDLALLQRVGRPVAVNPDQRLLAHARARNWEILRQEGVLPP